MEDIFEVIRSFPQWLSAKCFPAFNLSFMLYVLLVVLLVKIVVASSKKQKTTPGVSVVPGPIGLPLIGNILQLGPNPFVSFVQLRKRYGDVFKLRMGSQPVVVLNGRRAIHQAMVRQAIDFAGRPALASLGTYIDINGGSFAFTTYSDRWRLHHKLLYNALHHFTSGNRATSVERLVTFEVSELIKFILQGSESNVVDPSKLMKGSVSNIMAQILFQIRHDLDDEKLKTVVNGREKFLKALSGGNIVDFMPWLGVVFPGTMRDLEEIHGGFRDILGVYIDDHLTNHTSGNDSDIVYYLLTLYDKLSPTEQGALGTARDAVAPLAYDLFGAGTDTVAGNLEWAFLYALYYPEMQTKMQEEMDTVVGRDRLPSLADRGKLPLTEAFLGEVARHASVVPATVPHSTTRDTVLKGGYDYFIPKDTIVFANLYSVHHDPEQFDDPEVFNPSRFLTGDGTRLDIDKVDSITQFGLGRRRCAGSEVAQMKLFLFFTLMLHQCTLTKVGEISLEGKDAVIITVPQPYEMKVTRRD